MSIKIKSTTDYSLFKTKHGNRKVNQGGVKRLEKSIKKHNMLPVNPIIINEYMEVIDGQHRLQAAQNLGLPIYYVVFNPASLTEIQMLNANVRVWTAKDFIDSYISLGKQDYQIFKDFITKYDFPFSATLQILGSENLIRQNGAHQAFKEGYFEVKNLYRAEKIAELIESLLKNCYDSVRKSNAFYQSFIRMYLKYPQHIDTLITKSSGKNKIFRMERMTEYLRQFEDVLNKDRYGKQIRLY